MADNGENVAPQEPKDNGSGGTHAIFTGRGIIRTNRETYRKMNRASNRELNHARAQGKKPPKSDEERQLTIDRIKRKEAGERERIAKKKEALNDK
jgi:hypothetical protein